jgi:2-polyprenyl-6-hydroxyphenyl methylase/3-demethylubiquinone-9 3-methyltransferase
MSIVQRIRSAWRGRVQRWGNHALKRRLWNGEYAGGRWKHCENTQEDPVYRFIEKYARQGRILDLGCGAGNTGNELPVDAYSAYVGVDISDVAVAKAADRSRVNGRSGRNQYIAGDISTYVPEGNFDLILFRESMYYLRPNRMAAILEHYSRSLKEGGVFMVTIYDRHAFPRVVHILNQYRLVEDFSPSSLALSIKVFRER